MFQANTIESFTNWCASMPTWVYVIAMLAVILLVARPKTDKRGDKTR